VAGILESVLESDVFITLFVGKFRACGRDRADRWRVFSCDGCLAGRGSVEGVLEDAFWSFVCWRGRRVYLRRRLSSHGDH